MLIFISGTDSFLAKRAIDQIKSKYLQKNTSAELIEISPTQDEGKPTNWADLRAVPLFATTRLVIIRRVGELLKNDQENLAGFLSDIPDTTVAVVWDGKPLAPASLLTPILTKADKTIAAEPLPLPRVPSYIKKRAAELGIELEPALINGLATSFGTNLWALETELAKIALGGEVDQNFVSLHSQAEEQFVYFRLVRLGKWPEVARQLRKDFSDGKPMELLIGSLAAAIRKEMPNSSLKVDLTDLLVDVDVALKTSYLEPDDAVVLLAYYLPKPSQARVRWEDEWQTLRA